MYVFELVGEDDAFAAYEATSAASDVERVAPGVAVASELSTRIDQLGWTRSVSGLVSRSEATRPAMCSGLAAAPLEVDGPVAVRARGLRGAAIETPMIERALGDVLVEHGYEIDLEDPGAVLRVLVSDARAFLGWLVVEPGGDVGVRRPTDRPFFQPGSMAPRLARWLVNVAGAQPGVTVLDPMCGTGGIVLEAVRVGADAIGMDAQARMVRGTRRNGRALDTPGRLSAIRGDARRLPIDDGRIDAVVFDVPYGRQSKIAGTSLVPDALREGRRVAGRGVVVADRPVTRAATAAGWSVVKTFERRMHRSLTRHIAVLEAESGEALGTRAGTGTI